MYVIVKYSDYFWRHACNGIYTSFYGAIGHIVCLMDDEIRHLSKNGYILSKRTDYVYNEEPASWEWSIEMIPREDNKKLGVHPVHITWYLFQADVDKEETEPPVPANLPF